MDTTNKELNSILKFIGMIVLMATRHAYSPNRAAEIANELWNRSHDVS